MFNKVPINHIVFFNHISMEQVQENLEMLSYVNYRVSQKKMVIQKVFEFLTLGGVFLGVKNNSKNFGNKKKY